MKNLRKERLGYTYISTLGHRCEVVEYWNNKHVAVLDYTTDKRHICRWHDLNNVRKPEVCEAVQGGTSKIAEKTPTFASNDKNNKTHASEKASEIWGVCGGDSDIKELNVEDYAEPRNGCVLVWAIIAVVAVVITALYLVWR